VGPAEGDGGGIVWSVAWKEEESTGYCWRASQIRPGSAGCDTGSSSGWPGGSQPVFGVFLESNGQIIRYIIAVAASVLFGTPAVA
jgi:hypothetical protein